MNLPNTATAGALAYPSKAPSDGQYAMFQKAVERACEEVEVRHRNGDPDAATIVGRIILKLQALSPLMLEYGIPFPRSARGLPQCAPLLAMIRHAGMTWTKPVRELVNEMDKLHPKSMLAIRHLPEQAIDRAIDDYERKLVARGYGSPRSKSGGVDRIAAAEEIGCDPKELDVIARRRLSIINRQIGTPGPTTNRTGWSEGKRKYNPAVTQLINNGLERYFAGGLPEDPLNEGRIDFVTVAQTVGVAFGEIYDRPANVLMVESFAKGRPLLSNPFLAQRRYTYLDLMEYGYSRRDEEISAAGISASLVRRTTASLRAFILKVAAASLGAFVPLDFPQLVEQSLRARPSEHGSWWKEDMRRWILWNDELRAKKPLPDNFPLALRVLAHETGFTQNKLAVVSGINATILKSWLTGANTPSRSSQGHLARLASTLRVPVSIFTDLLSDAWRCRMLTSVAANYDSRLSRHLADNFSSMTVEDQRKEIDRAKTKYFNQDTPYSRRITEMSRDRYRLHKVNWPHAMQAAWDRQLPLIDSSYEEESWHMRIPGEELPPPSKQNGDISGSPQKYRAGTIDFKLGVAESILGYFSRPRELTAEQLEQSNMLDRSMTTTFRPAVGLGMPVDLLRPAIFLLPDLLTSFIWFRAKRSGAPGKMMLQALTLAAQFVRPEFGEVWKDPNMLDDLERIKKWWDANPHDFSEGDLKLDISPFRKIGKRQ